MKQLILILLLSKTFFCFGQLDTSITKFNGIFTATKMRYIIRSGEDTVIQFEPCRCISPKYMILRLKPDSLGVILMMIEMFNSMNERHSDTISQLVKDNEELQNRLNSMYLLIEEKPKQKRK